MVSFSRLESTAEGPLDSAVRAGEADGRNGAQSQSWEAPPPSTPRKDLTSPAVARASWLVLWWVEAGSWLPPKTRSAAVLWSTPATVLDHAGWGAGSRGGLLSHEVHLKDRSPQLLPSGLSDRPGEGSQVLASCLFSGTSVFTEVSSVLRAAMSFSLREGQDL